MTRAFAPLPRLALAAALALSSQAAGAAAGLCASDEIVLASCRTGQKTAAVCASRDLGPDSGHAQYRYGRPGAVELAFPNPPAHPRRFAIAGNVMFSGGGEAYLRLANGDHAYTFYDGMGRGWQHRGLLVTRGDRRLANFACRGPDEGDHTQLPEGTLPAAGDADEERWLNLRPDPGGR